MGMGWQPSSPPERAVPEGSPLPCPPRMHPQRFLVSHVGEAFLTPVPGSPIFLQ